MLDGLRKAIAHFRGGGDRPTILNPLIQAHMREPDRFANPFDHPVSLGALYGALGDAIRWGRAIDLRVSKELEDSHWWEGAEDGELVPGTRYVRNAVEHDWAQALDVSGKEGELVRGDVLRIVRWAPVNATRSTGRRQYEEHMLGKHIVLTLLAYEVVLLKGVTRL